MIDAISWQSLTGGLQMPTFGLGIFWCGLLRGWDVTLLGWAAQAQGRPTQRLTWTSSQGLDTVMPAWQDVSDQHKLLLQVLENPAALCSVVPLTALQGTLAAKAASSCAAHQLADHAAHHSSSSWKQFSLALRAETWRRRWQLEQWAAACVGTIAAHNDSRQPRE